MCSPVKDRIKLNYDKALNECRSVLVIGNRILLFGDTLAVRLSRLSRKQIDTYFNKDQVIKMQAGCLFEELDITHLHSNIRAFAGLTPGCSLEVFLKKFKDIRNYYEHCKHNLSLDKSQLKVKLDELLQLCKDILYELKNYCGNSADIALIDREIVDIGKRLALLKDTLEDELHEKAEEMKSAATNMVQCSATFDQKILTLTQITENATLLNADLNNATATINQSVETLSRLTENAMVHQADLKILSAATKANDERLTKKEAENTAQHEELRKQIAQIFANQEKIMAALGLNQQILSAATKANDERLAKIEAENTAQHEELRKQIAQLFANQEKIMAALGLNQQMPLTDKGVDEEMPLIEKNKSVNTHMSNELVPCPDSEESVSDSETQHLENNDPEELDHEGLFDTDEDIVVESHSSDESVSEPSLEKLNVEEEIQKFNVENDKLRKENEEMKEAKKKMAEILLLPNSESLSELMDAET